jgi:hypothetical protein
LQLPVSPRWREKHEAEKEAVVRMDFRTFVPRFIMAPARILRSGRRTIYTAARLPCRLAPLLLGKRWF